MDGHMLSEDEMLHETLLCQEMALNGSDFSQSRNYDSFVTSEGKDTQILRLTKSQLALYNEGRYNSKRNETSENVIDGIFSKVDTECPSALENWALKDGTTEENMNFNDCEANIQDLLFSLSETSEISNISDFDIYDSENGSKLDKICGLDEAKTALKNVFIYPTLYPQFFPVNMHWSQVLLFGPPGTGKSLLARTIAEEINANFYKLSSADLLSHWHGESEKQIRAIFEEARCSDAPVILFFDEIDGLCRRRSSSEDDLVRRIKTELLIQLQEDECNCSKNNRTYLIGATNCPWDIDSAFLRRFHRRIYIPLPDKSARIGILKNGFRELETELTETEWDCAGNLTQGYSGSDLINVVMGSCCERLLNTMKCKHWKVHGEFWVPATRDATESICARFKNIPRHQVRCRPIMLRDIEDAIAKTPKTVTEEELSKYSEYAAKNAKHSI